MKHFKLFCALTLSTIMIIPISSCKKEETKIKYASCSLEATNGTISLINENLNAERIEVGTKLLFNLVPNKNYTLESFTINDISVISSDYSFVVSEAIAYNAKATFISTAVEEKTYRTNTISFKNFDGDTLLSKGNFFSNYLKIEEVETSISSINNDEVNLKKNDNIILNFKDIFTFKDIRFISDEKTINLNIPSYETNALNLSYLKDESININSIEFDYIVEGNETKEASTKVNIIGEGEAKVVYEKGIKDQLNYLYVKPSQNYKVESIKVNNIAAESYDTSKYIYSFTLKEGVNVIDVNFIESSSPSNKWDYLSALTVVSPTRSNLGTVDSYYDSSLIRGKKGKELKDGLGKIISANFVQFSYDNLRESFKFTDEDPLKPGYMVLTYSGERYKISSFTSFTYINREHTWPNSRGVGKSGPGADKHMQRPSEQKINGARSNKDFGVVPHTSQNELKANIPNNEGNYTSSSLFEPKDEFKGDVARMIFYMATRYSTLELDRPSDDSKYNFFSASYLHGKFDDLYDWAMSDVDPVSDFEMSRNNKTDYMYQHNRNPFIDHPEFIKMIYDKNYDGPGALLDN